VRSIVLGAGLAGLAAAHELVRGRVMTTVVEAREAAGGRVRSISLAGGQTGELGGEFIEADHEAIRILADAMGVRLVRVLRGGFAQWLTGDDGRRHLSRSGPWTDLEEALAPLMRQYRATRGNPEAPAIREMATWSLEAYLRERQVSRRLHALAGALHGFFLADPDELSVLPVVEQLANGGSPAQAEMFRTIGGNSALVGALVSRTPARFLFRHVARAVHQTEHRVLVSVEDGHGHVEQLEADSVVVALPASTLRDIQFTPPMPEAQWRAMTRLRYGCATKVIVQLERQLFADRVARAFATDSDAGAVWDGGDGQAHDARSVVTFLGGGRLSGVLRERARRGAAALFEELCWLGPARATADEIHAATWEDEPWARGGYAFFDPAFDPAWRPLLARRFGRMVFAGEHTSERWQGYMTGAVETGARAARQLLENASE
jgi:monoamine oxidase